MKLKLSLVLLVLLLLGAGYVCVAYYPYVFAKHVEGEIISVERVIPPTALITGSGAPPSQVFSFAVGIRGKDNEIHTASSEDRQWAVAKPGQCAKATFFRYAPWNLDKGGTFYGARLDGLYDCAVKEEKK